MLRMRICQKHWDRLRKKLDELGIGHLGAKNSEDAIRAIVTDLDCRAAENDFDPLIACNNMIFNQGLKVCGLALMNPDGPNDGHYCPICKSVELYEYDWINGPAEAMLKDAKDKGLVP